jgi:UDP-3-O-[3-hydroxymyristoyl] glucosamine N-acyltransferase
MNFRIKNIVSQEKIFRDGVFQFTSAPGSHVASGICYAISKNVIFKINKDANIAAVITTSELAEYVDESIGVIVTDRPDEVYYSIHNELFLSGKMSLRRGQHIANSSHIAADVVLPEHVVIGERVIIERGAVIEDFTVIEDDAYIGQRAILGAIGMQSLKVNGVRQQVCFAGGVRVGQGCEVLANAIIQKPYQCFYTDIGNHTQVSVKVSVGHGSRIGDGCMIAGCVTIAGNVTIGNNVWIGPGSVIADGLKVGDQAKVRIGSVVVKNVAAESDVSGNFAVPHKINVRNCTKAYLENKK